ncbi:hypothetical protein [Myroides odoratus]|uniref:hypothetical protein n=1 Tax=Myroides odoratus TaxID=256 RepID=UPI000765CCF0|nr:hypothetical protein [Myroides odoratus]
MKTLLLSILLLFSSLISYGQLGFAATDVNRGKTVLTFKNGSKETGKIREKFTAFGSQYTDPYEFKFKSDGAKDYRPVSSRDVISVEVYDKKDEKHSTVYYPVRIRKFDKKYEFSDKYVVDFFPLNTYKDVPYAKLLFLDNGRLIFTHFYFPVANTDYFFFFHAAYRRTDRETAQFMMLMDKNCKAFQTYLQENYIDSKNYKDEYKQALADFKATKKEFIADRIANGSSKKLAKLEYKSEVDFVFFRQILAKYSELCTHENH